VDNGPSPRPFPRSGAELEAEVASLHEQYSAELLAYAASMARSQDTARDAVQEIFLRYFVERTYGREVNHPRAWLYRVLRNYLLDRLDSAAVRREVGPENAAEVPDQTRDPEGAVFGEQMARQIQAVLSPREMDCVRLRADGLSYDEIAAVLGIRPGTVSCLLTRVHKKLGDAAQDSQSGTLAALRLLVSWEAAHSS